MNEILPQVLMFLCLVVVFGFDWLRRKSVALERAEYLSREKTLLQMIRSLENRLSAKDLTGFLALEQEDRKAIRSLNGRGGDDATEAEIEAARERLIADELRLEGTGKPE